MRAEGIITVLMLGTDGWGRAVAGEHTARTTFNSSPQVTTITSAERQARLADQAYFTWIGYFAAANLWRDRVKNFKPSRGLTINVHDVSLS